MSRDELKGRVELEYLRRAVRHTCHQVNNHLTKINGHLALYDPDEGDKDGRLPAINRMVKVFAGDVRDLHAAARGVEQPLGRFRSQGLLDLVYPVLVARVGRSDIVERSGEGWGRSAYGRLSLLAPALHGLLCAIVEAGSDRISIEAPARGLHLVISSPNTEQDPTSSWLFEGGLALAEDQGMKVTVTAEPAELRLAVELTDGLPSQ